MIDYKIEKCISIIMELLKTEGNKQKLITEFQNLIWEEEGSGPEFEILSELAYDLDFYEPDPEKRIEHRTFYGEDKLNKEIKLALDRIHSLQSPEK